MSKSKKLTAYHEAGHAVMAHCLRKRIRHVSIIPEEDTLGHLQQGKGVNIKDIEWETSSRIRDEVEKRAMVFCAGNIVERLLTHCNIKAGSDADFSEAVSILSHLCGSDEETGLYANLICIRAKQCLQQPWNWAAVEALAKELIDRKYIGGVRARRIIINAIDQSLDLPTSHEKNNGGIDD